MAVYRRRVLEFKLETLTLPFAGPAKTGVNTLVFTLRWPRPGIVERVSSTTVDVQDGRASWAESRWGDRIVFKETVQGPCELGVHVLERQAPGKAALFLRRLAERLLAAAGKRVGDTEGMPAGGLVLGTALEYLEGIASDSKRASGRVVGVGAVDLRPGGTWKGGTSRPVRIPLAAHEALYRTKRVRRQGAWSTRRETLLEAGAANGMVHITVMPYE